MIKIDFQFEHNGLIFSDSIVLPSNHLLSEEQIESIKINRFEQWKATQAASNDEPEK
jgi:hypothetical protein